MRSADTYRWFKRNITVRNVFEIRRRERKWRKANPIKPVIEPKLDRFGKPCSTAREAVRRLYALVG